jgi:hypothetical protein
MNLTNLQLLYNLENRTTLQQHFTDCGLDPHKVGRLITKGGQHAIYEFGSGEVVKVPRFDVVHVLFGVQDFSGIQAEIDTLKSYFPEHMLDTAVYPSVSSVFYCIVQEKLDEFYYLDMENQQYFQEELSELVQRNEQLVQEKSMSLDWFGSHGMMQSLSRSISGLRVDLTMHNLVITANNKIRIMDTNLLIFDSETFLPQRFWKSGLYRLNSTLLKAFERV